MDEDGFVEPLLSDWDLISLQSSGLEIQLYLANPIEISQDDLPDVLFVQLEFSDFKDDEGQGLPESLVKQADMPRQNKSIEETQRLEN